MEKRQKTNEDIEVIDLTEEGDDEPMGPPKLIRQNATTRKAEFDIDNADLEALRDLANNLKEQGLLNFEPYTIPRIPESDSAEDKEARLNWYKEGYMIFLKDILHNYFDPERENKMANDPADSNLTLPETVTHNVGSQSFFMQNRDVLFASDYLLNRNYSAFYAMHPEASRFPPVVIEQYLMNAAKSRVPKGKRGHDTANASEAIVVE